MRVQNEETERSSAECESSKREQNSLLLFHRPGFHKSATLLTPILETTPMTSSLSARFFSACAIVTACVGTTFADERKPTISAAVKDDNGFLVHSVTSPYQAGTTKIRVLLPQTRRRQDEVPGSVHSARGSARR